MATFPPIPVCQNREWSPSRPMQSFSSWYDLGRCLALAITSWLLLGNGAVAQRVLLFEDFENGVSDLRADMAGVSVDYFSLSHAASGDESDPGTATVTGGSFPDPFPTSAGLDSDFDGDGDSDGGDFLRWQRGYNPSTGGASKGDGDANGDGFVNGTDLGIWQGEYGAAGGGSNKSLVFYNPNNARQVGASFWSIFPDDANDPNYYLKNGSVEYDVYFEQVPEDGYWTFLGSRLGFEANPENRLVNSITGDENIWNAFHMFDGGLNTDSNDNEVTDQISGSTTFSDETVLANDQALHVRYEIGNGMYSMFVDNLGDAAPEVEVYTDVPFKEVFNFQTFQNEPAPGINEITFITDASAYGVGSRASGNAYLDNLLIVDNDQAPLSAAVALTTQVPEPTALVLCLLSAGMLLMSKRRS